MRQRSISAVGVFFVGVVPSVFGGPIFGAVIVLLGLIGLNEYWRLIARLDARPWFSAYFVIVAFGLAALAGNAERIALFVVVVAVPLPLIVAIFRRDPGRAFVDWGLAVAGMLYLGLPVFAAVVLRQNVGTTDADWLNDLTDAAALGWDPAPRGFAWLMTVVFVTWLCDMFAYLVGRAIGRRRLIPHISPNKTIEGALGGLAGAAVTGVLCVVLFGLGYNMLIGAGVGLALGAVGQVGDLAESLLKRQVGVKDSGTLIPGHGGMLDRIDALLLAWPAGWLLANLVDRLAR